MKVHEQIDQMRAQRHRCTVVKADVPRKTALLEFEPINVATAGVILPFAPQLRGDDNLFRLLVPFLIILEVTALLRH